MDARNTDFLSCTETCIACGADMTADMAECAICGRERECPRCENVLDAGETCGCADEPDHNPNDDWMRDERKRYDDDGRDYADPGDFMKGYES